jgi:hypothetical protein
MSFSVFNKESRLLPAFSKPYPDELLSSWLTRMAFDHGLNVSELHEYIWPESNGHPDIDRVITNKDIQVFADRTNCSFEEVYNTTLSYYKHKLFSSSHMMMAPDLWLIHSKRVNARWKNNYHSGLMFCPGCLKKKAYFKKQWRLAVSFVCNHCGYYLVEECPNCKKGSSLVDTVKEDLSDRTVQEYLVNCHRCDHDVTDCEPEIAPPGVVKLQQQLYDIIDYGVNEKVVYQSTYFSILHQIASLATGYKKTDYKVRRLILDVYAVFDLPTDYFSSTEKIQLKELSVKKRATAIMLAHWLLEQWPDRLIMMCRKQGIVSHDLLPYFNHPPFWFWEKISYGLSPGFNEKKIPSKQQDEYTTILKGEITNNLEYDHDLDDLFYNADIYEMYSARDDEDEDYCSSDDEGNEIVKKTYDDSYNLLEYLANEPADIIEMSRYVA